MVRSDTPVNDPTPLRRALDAEREAREDVEAAEAEARAMVDQARARVRAIDRRAGERIARVSQAARARAERLLEEQHEEERAALDQLEHVPDDQDVLQSAARTVVESLTSGDEVGDTVAGGPDSVND